MSSGPQLEDDDGSSIIESIVSTDGGVSIRWRRLVELSVGSVLLGWLIGAIDLIGSIGSGIGSFVGGLSRGNVRIIVTITNSIESAILAAWESNASFIASLGAIAPIVAVVEIGIVLLILSWAFDWSIGLIQGGL